MNKIKKISVSTAIVFMVLCVLVGIVLGNGNALRKAMSTAEQGFVEVAALTDKRRGQAHNLLTLANRNIADEQATKTLSMAIDNAKKAKKPKEITKADDDIAEATAIVYAALQPVMNTSDANLATKVMDELSSVDKQIARAKKAYNNGLKDASEIYRILPAKWLLQNPEEAMT